MIDFSNFGSKFAAAISALAISAVIMATAIIPASPGLTAASSMIA